MKQEKRKALRFLENRFLLLLSVYAVSFLLCFLFAALLPTEGELLYPLFLVVPFVAFYLPLLFFLNSEEGYRAPIGLDRVKKILVPELALYTVASFFLGTGGALLYRFLGWSFSLYGGVAFPGKFTVLSFFGLVILSAFCEEMLVRGALQTHFTAFGSFLAILTSACFSSAYGFSVSTLPFLFFTGLLCAVARDRTKSLFSALSCAVVWRVGVYLVFLSVWEGLSQGIGGLVMPLIFIALALLFAVLALFTGRSKIRETGYRDEEERKRKVGATLFALLALLLSFGASFLILKM